MSEFNQLKELDKIIEILRGENGCPWDRKQTPEKMVYYLVEEAHELMQAIEKGDINEIREELGDVLFQVLFIAKIFQEQRRFDIDASAAHATDKMVRRHPHVFGDAAVADTEEVRNQWHRIKQREKAEKSGETAVESVLDSIPASLPPLMRAYRVSERAARTGFDWDDIHGVMAKAEEEWDEFKTEVGQNGDGENTRNVAMEFGDLLFTLVNVARFAGIHPASALNASTHKFDRRFRLMEARAQSQGRSIDNVPRDEKEAMWNIVKTEEAVDPKAEN